MKYNVTQLGNIGTVMDINYSGQMIGISTQSGTAFLYNPDPVSILTAGTTKTFQVTAKADWYFSPPPTLQLVPTVAAAINDAGEIAGTAYVPFGNKRAFLQKASGGVIGEVVDLHATLKSLLGYTWSEATDINNGPGENIGGSPMGGALSASAATVPGKPGKMFLEYGQRGL